MQDALKVSAQELTAALMVVVRDDDEDNAATALKIVVELHKAYKTQLEEHVSPFFSMVQEMYRNMEEAVRDTFDNPVSAQNGFVRSHS